MAAAATSFPTTASFRPASLGCRDGTYRVACRARSRVAASAAATTASSPEAASGFLVGVPSRGAGEQDRVSDLDGPGAMEYLTGVLASKVYDVAVETPLERADKLSDRLGVNLHIKREDLQPRSRVQAFVS